MKKSGLLLAILISMLSIQELIAQDQEQYLSKFRLLMKNGNNIEGEEGILTSTKLTGISSNGEKLEIPNVEL